MTEYVWVVELGQGRGIHLLRADQGELLRSYVSLGYKVFSAGAYLPDMGIKQHENC